MKEFQERFRGRPHARWIDGVGSDLERVGRDGEDKQRTEVPGRTYVGQPTFYNNLAMVTNICGLELFYACSAHGALLPVNMAKGCTDLRTQRIMTERKRLKLSRKSGRYNIYASNMVMKSSVCCVKKNIICKKSNIKRHFEIQHEKKIQALFRRREK